MLDWFKIPSELLILLGVSFIFVVIPTILTFLIRLSLHKYLNDLNKKITRLLTSDSSGQTSKIITNLEDRFQKASILLEHVNTSALVDEIYSQEQFPFFWLKLQCEKWDYFSRLLPNLLLAFGLVGTFGGITYNLYQMSNTLAETSLNTSQLVNQIQPYLLGMGIAFITSLIALLCSSFLTAINLIYNTTIAKYRFLSSLEDYLDNIYKPTVEGNTRLDKAVDRMVKQQEEFLTRFHEKVGQVLEDTFGKATNRLVEEHAESNRLARQVYENFRDAAGTISSSANTFRDASVIVQSQAVMFKESTEQMQKCLTRIVYFSDTIKASAEIIERSKFSEKLELTTTHLAETQATFANSVTQLVTNVEQVSQNYQKSVEVSQQVHTQLYNYSTNLQEASTDLKEGSKVFLQVSEIIRPNDLIAQISSLNENVREIIPLGETIKTVQDKIKLLSEIIIKNIELLQQVDKDLIKGKESLDNTGKNITDLITDTNQTHLNQLQVINGFDNLNEKIKTLQNVGQEIKALLLNKEVTKDNQIQIISKKFDYLNEIMANILTLAENNYTQ